MLFLTLLLLLLIREDRYEAMDARFQTKLGKEGEAWQEIID